MEFHSIGAFGLELFYGVGDELVAVIQYVGITSPENCRVQQPDVEGDDESDDDTEYARGP